jgi:glycosyltransferase involved in cell wall biosynthesis
MRAMSNSSHPPRVLMLSDVYFPRVNGVSTSIQTFRNALGALGCKTLLIAPEYPAAHEDEPGITRVPSWQVPFDPEDRLMRRQPLERACRSLEGQFDLVHIQTPFRAHQAGVRLARRLQLPVVESYHTYFEHYFHHYMPFLPRAWLAFAARSLSRQQCDAVDAVIAPSTQMADALAAYGLRSDIRIIPTGLDFERFRGGDGTSFRARFGIDLARPVMLTVGRVAFEKNIEFLIDVLDRVRRAVPKVLLLIAGEGPALGSLRRAVARRGLTDNTRFVGYLDRGTDLLDCYKSADVFVFASRTETQGLVVIEAMALGTPVVSTAVMGTKDVLDGARGAIVVEEDEHDFAAAVTRVLTDSAMRKSLGEQAAAFAMSNWSSASTAERMLDLYAHVSARGVMSPSVGLAAR